MHNDFIKAAQDNFKPVLKLAQSNTDCFVELLNNQAKVLSKVAHSNVSYWQALTATEDFEKAVELQQQHTENLQHEYVAWTRQNARVLEATADRASNISKIRLHRCKKQPGKLSTKKPLQCVVRKLLRVARKPLKEYILIPLKSPG